MTYSRIAPVCCWRSEETLNCTIPLLTGDTSAYRSHGGKINQSRRYDATCRCPIIGTTSNPCCRSSHHIAMRPRFAGAAITCREQAVPAQQMSLISDLWKLQEIDSALDARRGSLDDSEARLGESEELLAARERKRELQDAARRARTEQKDIELEADELRSKIAPLEAKLYGGSIRNPKELAD